jgi:hypothetical protein
MPLRVLSPSSQRLPCPLGAGQTERRGDSCPNRACRATLRTAAFLRTPIATTKARALTEVTGLKLPRAGLVLLMENNPRLGYEIMKQLSETLVRRIRQLYGIIAVTQMG